MGKANVNIEGYKWFGKPRSSFNGLLKEAEEAGVGVQLSNDKSIECCLQMIF